MKLKKILGITLQVLKKQLTLPQLGQQHRSHMKKTVN